MADFCHSCALDTFGECIGDLAGLSTPEDTTAHRYIFTMCEGCGPIYVDHTGCRVADPSDGQHRATPATPRILNKRSDVIPSGAIYIGRGSPWGNPFVIGRDGTRDEVIAKHEAWIASQPRLLARLPELQGRDLVCFCAPRCCHGDTLRRMACETV